MKPADIFFTDGCGRCPLMSTSNCKVQKWKNELKLLREILQSSGLTEEIKWGMPTYTLGKANVAMIAAFKQYCSISFFKGVLLHDPKALLSSPGEHSQSVKLLKFTTTKQIQKDEKQIKIFIADAIQNEKLGIKVDLSKRKSLVLSPEFISKLEKDARLKNAFEALTPGRKRSHHLYIAGAKQSKTREDRVERSIPFILKGKGWNEY